MHLLVELRKENINAKSNIILRKLEIPPGVVENSKKSALIVYPNPFSEKITIEWFNPISDNIYLKILDIHGRTLFNDRSTATSSGLIRFEWNGINTIGKQVENGSYFIQISSGSNVLNKTIILRKD